jgi:hypothetical protein
VKNTATKRPHPTAVSRSASTVRIYVQMGLASAGLALAGCGGASLGATTAASAPSCAEARAAAATAWEEVATVAVARSEGPPPSEAVEGAFALRDRLLRRASSASDPEDPVAVAEELAFALMELLEARARELEPATVATGERVGERLLTEREGERGRAVAREAVAVVEDVIAVVDPDGHRVREVAAVWAAWAPRAEGVASSFASAGGDGLAQSEALPPGPEATADERRARDAATATGAVCGRRIAVPSP